MERGFMELPEEKDLLIDSITLTGARLSIAIRNAKRDRAMK
jgi:hypothetical protein